MLTAFSAQIGVAFRTLEKSALGHDSGRLCHLLGAIQFLEHIQGTLRYAEI